MSRFPSSLTMIVSILIIAILSSMKFHMKLEREHFQLKFDWKKEKEIQRWRSVTIDSLDYNYLKLSNIDSAQRPNYQNTFAIQTDKNEKYFFRFIDMIQSDNTITLSAVVWITGMPYLTDGKVDLYEFDIPLEVKSGKTIVTIGDEMMVKDEAKYFRRKMASKPNFNFEGRTKDVFNYKHEAEYGKTLQEVVQQLDDIPKADYYVIFFSKPEEEDQKYASELLNALSTRKSTERIIWIHNPLLNDLSKKNKKSEFENFLFALDINKLKISNTDSLFGDHPEIYYMPDGIHFNKLGYEKLASETVKLLR